MKTVLAEVNCPEPFTKLENLTGCYFAVLNGHAIWSVAVDECQKLHPSAYLIGLNSNEVGIFSVMSMCIHFVW